MVRDKSQMMFDIAVVIAIIIAVYYIKTQATGDVIGPFEGLQAFLRVD